MSLCPESFQSQASGLYSLLTRVEWMLFASWETPSGTLGFTLSTFLRLLNKAPELGLWVGSCSLWFGGMAPPGCSDCPESCPLTGHLPEPHQLPLSNMGPPNGRQPWSPLDPLTRERGRFKVFAPFKQYSWKLKFIGFIVFPLEKKTKQRNTFAKILQKETLLLAQRPSPLCQQGSASSPVWRATCWRVWSKCGTNSATNYFGAKMNFV